MKQRGAPNVTRRTLLNETGGHHERIDTRESMSADELATSTVHDPLLEGRGRDMADDMEDADTDSPVRVLLADDDRDTREAVAEALRSDGYEVIEAHNGWELLQHLAAGEDSAPMPVNLVISDVRMPGKNGLEVLAGFRWATGGSTPFIVITGFGDSQTHAEARRLGASAVLAKPFELDQLRTVMLDALA
jgi:CheY-like chemotaxis protein